MKKVILMMLAVTALAGCSKLERISEDDGIGVPVELYGVITDATRGDGVISGTTPSAALDLIVFRADMSSGGSPVYTSDYAKHIGGTMATSGAITLSPKQYYFPTANQKTKFIGVYPANGTVDLANRTVTYSALDGAMDVMVSNFAEGYKENKTISLSFDHILTKIQVEVKANGNDTDEYAGVSDSWGKITSIALEDKKTGAVVTLPAPNSGGDVTIATTGTPENLPLTATNGTAAPDLTIPKDGTTATYGYAMFLPVETAGILTLLITTENSGGVKTVNTISNQKFEKGKGYKITVGFTVDDAELEVGPGSTSGGMDNWTDNAGSIDAGNVQ